MMQLAWALRSKLYNPDTRSPSPKLVVLKNHDELHHEVMCNYAACAEFPLEQETVEVSEEYA
jgi:hypothetical protein